MADLGTVPAPGEVGNAIHGSATITNSSSLVLTQDFTIELWANLDVVVPPNSGGYRFVTKSIPDDDHPYWDFHYSDGNAQFASSLLFDANFGGSVATTSDYVAHPRLVHGQWYHLAVTGTAGQVTFYVDGVPQPLAARRGNGAIPALTNPVRINAGGPALTDEVSIYASALSASELRAIYLAGPAGKCRGGATGPTGPTALPNPPSALTSMVSNTSVTFTWAAPSIGSPVTGYVLEAGSGPGLTDVVVVPTNNAATSFSASGPPGRYFVRVKAQNAAGTSGPSNEVVFVLGTPAPCGPLPAPAGLTVSRNGALVSLTWGSVVGALSYRLEAGSSTGSANLAVVDTGASSTSFQAMAPSGTYYVRVRAVNTCGSGTTSNEVIVTVP